MNDDLLSGWSCDDQSQQKRLGCRNPHGCHCREITSLVNAKATATAEIARLEARVKELEGNQRNSMPIAGGRVDLKPTATAIFPAAVMTEIKREITPDGESTAKWAFREQGFMVL